MNPTPFSFTFFKHIHLKSCLIFPCMTCASLINYVIKVSEVVFGYKFSIFWFTIVSTHLSGYFVDMLYSVFHIPEFYRFMRIQRLRNEFHHQIHMGSGWVKICDPWSLRSFSLQALWRVKQYWDANSKSFILYLHLTVLILVFCM